MYDRDADAFAELYDRYAPSIYRYIFFKVGSAEQAEDLTSDVFLKTWEFVERREKRLKSFRPFVYQVARRTVIDHYRSREREPIALDEDALATLPQATTSAEIEKIVAASDRELVERALCKLKQEYRDVIILRLIEGYSTGDVAEMLEKSRGAVRVTLHRALDALRNEMKSFEETPSPSSTIQE